MSQNQRILGLILARGGSKGIPKKNIKELNGKPLLSYVLEEALKSEYLETVWVSSDEQEIIDIASNLGAWTIKRPQELSDGSKPIESIQHFISNVECDIIVLLNACCPLTKVEDIDGVIRLALESEVDSVTSLVKDLSCHPSKVCHLSYNGDVQPLEEELFYTGERQKLSTTYKRNTAIYLMRRKLIEQGNLFNKNTKGYIMPKERSWDINDMWDFKVAEFLIKNQIN